jgi:predicted nucleic acid-binding protein
MIVVSDATPLHYLILIGQTDVLPRLYGQVIIPPAVFAELRRESTPVLIRTWVSSLPEWMEVRNAEEPEPPLKLGRGEREALTLAAALNADLLLLDDKQARRAALESGFAVTGTLGVLEAAAHRNLLDLPEALDRLKQTNFRAAPRLYDALLERYIEERQE